MWVLRTQDGEPIAEAETRPDEAEFPVLSPALGECWWAEEPAAEKKE